MTRKIQFLFVLFFSLSLSTVMLAQDDNPDFSNLKYSAQPKHMWEVGLHAGHFMVIGDVLPRPSWGAGLHVRRAIDYAWSIRLDGQYGIALGLEPRNAGAAGGHATANKVLKKMGYGNGNAWYPNYKMEYLGLSLQGVWSLNTFNFKQQIKKYNWYVLGGAGINSYKTFYDAQNGSTAYDFSTIGANLDPNDSRPDRRIIASDLRSLLDGDYETRAEVARGRRSGNGEPNDRGQINPTATAGFGLAYRISNRINLALEHQATVTFGNEGDLLDGYRWRTTEDLTQFRDVVNYTNLRLNINLGDKDKKSEPLWWVSPMDLLAEDLAAVKARPELDLTDTDGDGIIDMLDQEKDTPAGCPVDTRGIVLDSDGDGVTDCKDKEPHSPPGYKVDGDGVASVPAPPDPMTEADVNKIVDAKMASIPRGGTTVVNKADWFLPMIHYDLNKYSIKNTEYGKLHNVATVLQKNPDIRVVVSGYTDKTAGNCYNDVLSYNRAQAAIDYLTSKYGISRSRLILNWGGENTTLVPTEGRSLMNRRVEFSVATSQSDMGRPDCGVGSAGSGGTNYSGNKEAGY